MTLRISHTSCAYYSVHVHTLYLKVTLYMYLHAELYEIFSQFELNTASLEEILKSHTIFNIVLSAPVRNIIRFVRILYSTFSPKKTSKAKTTLGLKFHPRTAKNLVTENLVKPKGISHQQNFFWFDKVLWTKRHLHIGSKVTSLGKLFTLGKYVFLRASERSERAKSFVD